jgi:hypothetical protein
VLVARQKECRTGRKVNATLQGNAMILRFASKLLATAGALAKTPIKRWLDIIAERQARRARFEMEMYRGAYRYSSKNDDDLPIGR